jgi:hypothetical protein
MKTKNYIMYSYHCWVFSLLSILVVGCEENTNLVDYKTEKAYIYFAQPNLDTRSKEKWVDSITYSFAIEPTELKQKVFAIPLHVAGIAANRDRKVSCVVNRESSKIDMNIVSIKDAVIHAGQYTDTLYVTVQNAPRLRDTIMDLVLDLQSNEEFQIGHTVNKRIKISFTNQLLEPEWWKRWVNVFGSFRPEVYKLWIQIYYLGIDPSPDIYGEFPAPYYYWNNMPFSASASSSPVTFMYIDVLRKYLQENEVYPNGDPAKERIYLP